MKSDGSFEGFRPIGTPLANERTRKHIKYSTSDEDGDVTNARDARIFCEPPPWDPGGRFLPGWHGGQTSPVMETSARSREDPVLHGARRATVRKTDNEDRECVTRTSLRLDELSELFGLRAIEA